MTWQLISSTRAVACICASRRCEGAPNLRAGVSEGQQGHYGVMGQTRGQGVHHERPRHLHDELLTLEDGGDLFGGEGGSAPLPCARLSRSRRLTCIVMKTSWAFFFSLALRLRFFSFSHSRRSRCSSVSFSLPLK